MDHICKFTVLQAYVNMCVDNAQELGNTRRGDLRLHPFGACINFSADVQSAIQSG